MLNRPIDRLGVVTGKDRLHNFRADPRHEAIIEKIIKKYADEGVEISTSEAIRIALRFWEKETKKKT